MQNNTNPLMIVRTYMLREGLSQQGKRMTV
uniref:Uncharacterized protein n=1 Tax=Arundo donax TaxID=35708 RepID=A0A0A8Z7R8_ARUDO